jgi:ubiquinol-cytochrome c reductase cytochrome c1 subunit
MKKWIVGCLVAFGVISGASAAKSNFPMDRAPNLSNDMAALQSGARLFMNYCIGCHSASFMRYNRLTEIGLTERQIQDNLMFTTDRVGDIVRSNLNPTQAKEWLGKNPPDLTLMAFSRSTHFSKGTDYLYSLLRNYYRDPDISHGWNNLNFPAIGMPNPLWELQGERRPIMETVTNARGEESQILRGWEQVTPGTMTPAEYDRAVAELVAFMEWMADPLRRDRVRMGVWVMIFLSIFTLLAWRLNASYWKDVK